VLGSRRSRPSRTRPGAAPRGWHEARVVGEQIDFAVDLGAVPAPLPEILSLRQLEEWNYPVMRLARDLNPEALRVWGQTCLVKAHVGCRIAGEIKSLLD
jgi:hypothetical protein